MFCLNIVTFVGRAVSELAASKSGGSLKGFIDYENFSLGNNVIWINRSFYETLRLLCKVSLIGGHANCGQIDLACRGAALMEVGPQVRGSTRSGVCGRTVDHSLQSPVV